MLCLDPFVSTEGVGPHDDDVDKHKLFFVAIDNQPPICHPPILGSQLCSHLSCSQSCEVAVVQYMANKQGEGLPLSEIYA